MDIKRKTCDIGTWKKRLFLDISSTNMYTCPIALPVRQNPQHRNLCFCCSLNRGTWTSLKEFLDQLWTTLHDKHFPPWTGNISLCISFALCPAHKKCSTEHHSSLAHSSSMAGILTTETSLWTCTCTSATWTSHEAGLCSYLVIHIENLLRPLQLFYFHLWPVYWLSIILVAIIGIEPEPS
jgi:hypothetical protein